MEAQGSRIIPPDLQELLVVYMDFLKKNKDIIDPRHHIFTFFEQISAMLCSSENFDAIYQHIIGKLIEFGLEIEQNRIINDKIKSLVVPIPEMILGSHRKSLLNQLNYINIARILSSDYETIFDALQIVLDASKDTPLVIQANSNYMNEISLNDYIDNLETKYSGLNKENMDKMIHCFLEVNKKYYNEFLNIYKKKGSSTAKQKVNDYNQECQSMYNQMRAEVFTCMSFRKNFIDSQEELNILWRTLIGSKSINLSELVGTKNKTQQFINFLKKYVEAEVNTYKSPQNSQVFELSQLSQDPNSFHSPKKSIRSTDPGSAITMFTPLVSKMGNVSHYVSTAATRFTGSYDDIFFSQGYVSIEEILLRGKPVKDQQLYFIPPDQNRQIYNAIFVLLTGKRISLEAMAEKRKRLLGLLEDSPDKDFMTQMIYALFLIMTQCDLMHDIILRSLSGVWDQCETNYQDLLYTLKRLRSSTPSEKKDEYLGQLGMFHQQLQECWSQGGISKAIQEKVRNLRQNINFWLMTIVKLPKQDFESQLLTREEAMKVCLNFYGEHGETHFAFRESGRPPLDFVKTKIFVEALNNEDEKEEFMKDITPKGLKLLNEILDCKNKEAITDLEKKYTSQHTTLTSIDGCLKAGFNTDPQSHVFPNMFGRYNYHVYSTMPKSIGSATASLVAHLIVVTSNEDSSIIAVFSIIGPITVNNVLASFFALGGSVTERTAVGRGNGNGTTNLYKGTLVNFLQLYKFNISQPDVDIILKQTGTGHLAEKNPGLCAYFLKDIAASVVAVLTLGLKTICDEVLDSYGNKVKLAITCDSLVHATLVWKYLIGYKPVLPGVFRSVGNSYFMNEGKLEINLEIVSKELFLKILKYNQLAISLKIVTRHFGMRNLIDLDALKINLDALKIVSGKFFSGLLQADVELNDKLIINRYVNLVYSLYKITQLPDIFSDDVFDSCSGFIMRLNAKNVFNDLLINIDKMKEFLDSYMGDKDIEKLVDNINSLPDVISLLRVTQANAYQNSSTVSYPKELVDALGKNYEVKIMIVSVTETTITFYTCGQTENLKKALSSQDFDVSNVEISCQKSFSGRQTTTKLPVTFHELKYTYPIEFLIKILINLNLFEIPDDISDDIYRKIQYFCIKYFVNNYETVKKDVLQDQNFFNLLNTKFRLDIFSTYIGHDIGNYDQLKTALDNYDVTLEKPDGDDDDEQKCGDSAKSERVCDTKFQDWFTSKLYNLKSQSNAADPFTGFDEKRDVVALIDPDTSNQIQEAINRMSRLIMTNCGTTDLQYSKEVDSEIDAEINIDSGSRGLATGPSSLDYFVDSLSQNLSPIRSPASSSSSGEFKANEPYAANLTMRSFDYVPSFTDYDLGSELRLTPGLVSGSDSGSDLEEDIAKPYINGEHVFYDVRDRQFSGTVTYYDHVKKMYGIQRDNSIDIDEIPARNIRYYDINDSSNIPGMPSAYRQSSVPVTQKEKRAIVYKTPSSLSKDTPTKRKTPDPLTQPRRGKGQGESLFTMFGNKPPGGGKPSTRRRHYKVKRFTKCRKLRKRKGTKKTYRKKYKTRRR